MDEFFSNHQDAAVTSRRILYTPSAFARSALLYLQEIGELKAHRSHESRRTHLQSFLFFMVVDGSGSLSFGRQNYDLTAGDCIFIDCMNQYAHITDEKQLWTLRWVHFYGTNMPEIYQKYKECGGKPVFHPDSLTRFTSVWNDLMEMAGSGDYIRDVRINEGLNGLLTLLMEQSWHPENHENVPKKKSGVVSVKEYLDQHYSEKISLDDLASRFYINKYYLTKVFKQQYGLSINAYLLQVRITRAKQMLRFSDKSVEEIGLECGLGPAHYFSAKFREVEGMPPSRFRAQWQA